MEGEDWGVGRRRVRVVVEVDTFKTLTHPGRQALLLVVPTDPEASLGKLRRRRSARRRRLAVFAIVQQQTAVD